MRLLGRRFSSATEAVGWHLAFQSQEFGLAKWGLGRRVARVKGEDVEAQFADGAFLRTHVMRPTWHFVLPDDIVWLMELTGPRVRSGNRGRFAELGLDIRELRRSQRTISRAIHGGGPMTRKELSTALGKDGIEVDGQRLHHILLSAELDLAICSGPPAGKKQTYALVEDRAPNARVQAREDSLIELVGRYLASHGPATEKDLRWWSGLPLSDIRFAIDALGDALVTETIDGLTFLRARDSKRPASFREGVAHLLQPFDEYTVAYTVTRSIAYPPGPAPGLDASAIVDGEFVGTWRKKVRGAGFEVSLDMRRPPTGAEKDALARELGRMERFLGAEGSLALV